MKRYHFYFLKNFYLSQEIHAPLEEILESIWYGKYYQSLYLITLPQNNKNIAEIISLKQIVNLSGIMSKPFVIGVSKTKKDAIELLAQILIEEKVVAKNYNLSEVFKNNFLDYSEKKEIR